MTVFFHCYHNTSGDDKNITSILGMNLTILVYAATLRPFSCHSM